MRLEYDWSKYKNGLHLLLLNEDVEQELIEILECSYDTAMNLEVQELLSRRKKLQELFKEYGETLKKECYELFYMLGNMENNYSYILEIKKGEIDGNKY